MPLFTRPPQTTVQSCRAPSSDNSSTRVLPSVQCLVVSCLRCNTCGMPPPPRHLWCTASAVAPGHIPPALWDLIVHPLHRGILGAPPPPCPTPNPSPSISVKVGSDVTADMIKLWQGGGVGRRESHSFCRSIGSPRWAMPRTGTPHRAVLRWGGPRQVKLSRGQPHWAAPR